MAGSLRDIEIIGGEIANIDDQLLNFETLPLEDRAEDLAIAEANLQMRRLELVAEKASLDPHEAGGKSVEGTHDNAGVAVESKKEINIATIPRDTTEPARPQSESEVVDTNRVLVDDVETGGNPRMWYHRTLLNPDGFDRYGYDQRWQHRDGYVSGFDCHGFNKDGLDEENFSRSGYNGKGIDRWGNTVQGEWRVRNFHVETTLSMYQQLDNGLGDTAMMGYDNINRNINPGNDAASVRGGTSDNGDLLSKEDEFGEEDVRHQNEMNHDVGEHTSRSSPGICDICGEEKPHTLGLECPHFLCPACIVKIFETAVSDRSFFPARCCSGPIDTVESVLDCLELSLAGKYNDRRVELEATDHVYCSVSKCSALIPPARIHHDGYAYCQKCGQRTCAKCRCPKAMHSLTGSCGTDADVEELKKIAQAQEWQRCRKCQRFVELDDGCYHITCICDAQFCYLCGEVWKTCGCPGNPLERAQDEYDEGAEWDGHEPNDWGVGLHNVEQFIANGGNGVVPVGYNEGEHNAAQPGGWGDGPNEYDIPDPEQEQEVQQNQDPAIRFSEVRRHAEALRAQHECEEHDFIFHYGGDHCDVCRWNSHTFIYRCAHCRLQSCRACTSHDVRATSPHVERRRVAATVVEEVADEIGELFDGLMERVQAGDQLIDLSKDRYMKPVIADMD